MNTLLELQTRFSRSIMNPCDDIEAWLTDTPTPALAIYQNAYRIRLQETLAQDYPALKALLGEQAFAVLASEYIRTWPSRTFSLRTFGQCLPQFVSTQANDHQLACLAELAEFEWHLNDVFDGADTPVAQIETMQTIPAESWPSLTVKLQASIRWMSVKWNIDELYPDLKMNNPAAELRQYPHRQQILIWRQNYSPHYRCLEDQEWLALKTFENHNFSRLCLTLSELIQTPDQAPLEAATYLKSWLAAGLIESIT